MTNQEVNVRAKQELTQYLVKVITQRIRRNPITWKKSHQELRHELPLPWRLSNEHPQEVDEKSSHIKSNEIGKSFFYRFSTVAEYNILPPPRCEKRCPNRQTNRCPSRRRPIRLGRRRATTTDEGSNRRDPRRSRWLRRVRVVHSARTH